MRLIPKMLVIAVLVAASAWALLRLVDLTYAKEGFADNAHKDVEDPLTPQQFSFQLLQGVMGPIRRLSAQLVNMDNWKERWELANLSPTELARRHLSRSKGAQ